MKTKIITLLCSFILIISSLFYFTNSAQAIGNSYYVSPTGNDSNTGTYESPLKTIQRACNIAQAGSTVYIQAGTYNEKIQVPISGTQAAYITIRNYNNDTVILDGTGISGQGITISNKNYIRIQGLTIQNFKSGNTPMGIYVSGYGTGIEILNNKVTQIISSQNAHGIAAYGTNGSQSISNLTISGNEVYNCQLGSSESVVVNGNVNGFTISNNTVHDNNNIGIDCIGFEKTASSNDQARNGIVSENLIYNITSKGNPAYGNDTCADGLYVDGGTSITIERNRVYNCDIGIEVASEHSGKVSDNIVVRNNIVSGCGLYGLCFGGSSSKNGYAQNCKFVNNTLYNNVVGIVIQKAQNNVLENNIIYGTSTLREGTVGTNVFSYNIWYAASSSLKPTLSATDKFVNPLFISISDFHLQSSSPAINGGDSILTTSVVGSTDYDGNQRIVTSVDCGAYEYASIIIPTPTFTVTPSPTPTITPTVTPAPTLTPTSNPSIPLTMSSDATNIALSFIGTNLNQKSQFYINSDNNINTGYKDLWSTSGNDYLIENNQLFKYSGMRNSWKWTYVKNVTLIKNNTLVQVIFPFRLMNVAVGSKIKVGFISNDKLSTLYPIAQNNMASFIIGQ